jgi:predicted deacetylase
VLLLRYLSSRQLDDVSPEIQCDEALLEKSDILYVIPKFDNSPISENKEWCSYILSLNKTLAMHGVYHIYQEFKVDRTETYLQEGIEEFEKCFGKKPDRFKPPQLVVSKNNKRLIKEHMKLNFYLNEIFHKSYHCNDTGKYSNSFIDVI